MERARATWPWTSARKAPFLYEAPDDTVFSEPDLLNEKPAANWMVPLVVVCELCEYSVPGTLGSVTRGPLIASPGKKNRSRRKFEVAYLLWSMRPQTCRLDVTL